jgi:hypothetical protein
MIELTSYGYPISEKEIQDALYQIPAVKKIDIMELYIPRQRKENR